MSILSSVKTFILTYPSLESGALVLVDNLGEIPIQYAICPLPGPPWDSKNVSGGGERTFPFAFQMAVSTVDELERLDNNGFFEAFSDWLDDQTEDDILPTLGTGKTPSEIMATTLPYLSQQGESGTGIYMAQYKLIYSQEE